VDCGVVCDAHVYEGMVWVVECDNIGIYSNALIGDGEGGN